MTKVRKVATSVDRCGNDYCDPIRLHGLRWRTRGWQHCHCYHGLLDSNKSTKRFTAVMSRFSASRKIARHQFEFEIETQ
ncbi:unnamed protein product, partial [Sphenostylis stenocarpa]